VSLSVLTDISADLRQVLQELQLVIFDFDGVFTDNTVWTNQEGIESVRCSRSDGLGLDRLREIGLQMCIISTETNPVVATRARKLKIECFQSVSDKAVAVREIVNLKNVELSKTCFLGNDINDIPAFSLVGLPVAVSDAYPEVLQFVKYQTKSAGGFGAVRELCDLIYFARRERKD